MTVFRQSGKTLPQLSYVQRHLERFLPLLAAITKPYQKADLAQVFSWAGVNIPAEHAAPLNVILRAASKNMHSNGYHHPWHTMTVMILSAVLGQQATLSSAQMKTLMIYALVHDLDHRGGFASLRIYDEEMRSAQIANRRLHAQYSARGRDQNALESALRASAFGAKDHQIDDEITSLLVDADILGSVIFPFEDVLKLTKGLKLEKRAGTPSLNTLQSFLNAVSAKGFKHQQTRHIASHLTSKRMAVWHVKDAAKKLGFNASVTS